MKIALVTGAGGWIGSELVKELLSEGYKVKALVRKESESLRSLKTIYNENLEIIFGDMNNIQEWEENLINIDFLFHLAAKVHSKPKNKEDEKEFYLINRDKSIELFNKSIKYKIGKVIFISTVAVYGNHGEKSIDIKSDRKPETPYAISKNEAEIQALNLYKEKKLPVSIIQPVTVYGGKDRGNFKKLYNMANKGFLVRFGNGENKKSVIYYKDLVEMIIKIAEDRHSIGKIFICGTENIEYNKILKKMKDDSSAKFLFKVPRCLAKVIIQILSNTRISKLNNLSQNINTLMNDNIYSYLECKKYITEVSKFENWNCKYEYNERGGKR